MIDLRPYQLDVIAEYERAVEAGQRKIILVAPTGSGKTVIAAAIIARAVEKGHRVVILSHRTEIVQQTRDILAAGGTTSGVIQAGLDDQLRLYERVQVASIATLTTRAVRTKTHGASPGHVAGHRRVPSRTSANVPTAYRSVSRRDLAGADRYALPW
jgi:superfamily II DNA or RNA helicase